VGAQASAGKATIARDGADFAARGMPRRASALRAFSARWKNQQGRRIGQALRS
jgi:hypothetical protein